MNKIWSPVNNINAIRLNNRRVTVGFLIDNIVSFGNYQTLIWEGVVRYSKKHDANLISFVSGTLEYSPYNEFEKQRNSIYSLISKKNIDALIITGALASFVPLEKLYEFHKKFRGIPTVSIGTPLENIPSITVENYSGIKMVVDHLIIKHGYRRIAFVRGPAGIPEADDRYRAYTDSLMENDIKFDKNLVVTDDFLQPSGVNAVKDIFEKNRQMPEAIVCANDNMALGVIAELKKRKLSIPGDVAVTGFDDIEEANAYNPGITTVKQPIVRMGELAVEMILAVISREKVPILVNPETKIVIRQSCGCSSHIPFENKNDNAVITIEKLDICLREKRNFIYNEVINTINLLNVEPKIMKLWVKNLLVAFSEEVMKPSNDCSVFLNSLRDILNEAVNLKMDLSLWYGILSVIKQNIQTLIMDYETSGKIATLWNSATILTGESVKRSATYQKLLGEKQATILYHISQTLITIFDINKLLETIEKGLPNLEIDTCLISFYDNSERHSSNTGEISEWSRIMFAYNSSKHVIINDTDRIFLSTELFPDAIFSEEKKYSLVVESLSFGDEKFGFIIFDSDPAKGMIYSTLSGQISSAIKGALIFKDQKQTEKKLIDTLEELKQINEYLYNLSLKVELTGLYNRRGFIQLGEQQVKLSIRNKKNPSSFSLIWTNSNTSMIRMGTRREILQ